MVKKSPAFQLAKTLAYILGRKPDEFGLVPNSDGFVKIKELLKALSEEKGLRYVRRGHLEEIIMTLPEAPFEINENLIRARDRAHLPPRRPAQNISKLLYTCIRRKAYPVVIEKGVSFDSSHHVVLSSERDMAERIGRRSDAAPILLTVSVRQAQEAQVRFLWAGGTLYLAESLPPSCFTGPPLTRVVDTSIARETSMAPEAPVHPGSFFPDPGAIQSGEAGEKKNRRGDRPDWKRDRKRRIRMERKKGPRF